MRRAPRLAGRPSRRAGAAAPPVLRPGGAQGRSGRAALAASVRGCGGQGVTVEFPVASQTESIRNAGPTCGDCGRHLADGEPLYSARRWVEREWGRSRHLVTDVCGGCLREWERRNVEANPWRSGPCDGCDRPLWCLNDDHLPEDRRRRWCSEACRGRARYRTRRLAESRPCAVCGEPFTARRGARTCSARCRQAAYRARRRKTTKPNIESIR